MSDAVIVTNATKVIKGRTVLDDICLSLPEQGVYGFCGANGSGKTMLLRAICGLVHLTSGKIEVFGREIGMDDDFPQGLGLLMGADGLWDEYTGMRNLELLASIRNTATSKEIEESLERVGLKPSDNRRVREYSLGMRQRLLIAQAIMEKPSLLVLDEPTIALDVQGLGLLLRIIEEERDRGATILVACHNEPDLESMFDRRFYMSEGAILPEDSQR